MDEDDSLSGINRLFPDDASTQSAQSTQFTNDICDWISKLDLGKNGVPIPDTIGTESSLSQSHPSPPSTPRVKKKPIVSTPSCATSDYRQHQASPTPTSSRLRPPTAPISISSGSSGGSSDGSFGAHPGIPHPGSYRDTGHNRYFLVVKGLGVGIFTNWYTFSHVISRHLLTQPQ